MTTEVLDKEMILVSQIRVDGGTQNRAAINEETVEEYAEAMRRGDTFPPVEVYYDGENYWLADGFHRVEATRRRGEYAGIAAVIHTGTKQDAQWAAYSANRSHGLQRTNADKERAIRAALRHPRAHTMSSSQIAFHVGASDKTVAKYRSEMEATSEIPKSDTRTGADGRTINTSNIGKREVAMTGVPTVGVGTPGPELKAAFAGAKLEEEEAEPIITVSPQVIAAMQEDNEIEAEAEEVEPEQEVTSANPIQNKFGCAACRYHSTSFADIEQYNCSFLGKDNSVTKRRIIGVRCEYWRCGDSDEWLPKLEQDAPEAKLMVSQRDVTGFVATVVGIYTRKVLALVEDNPYQNARWQEVATRANELLRKEWLNNERRA